MSTSMPPDVEHVATAPDEPDTVPVRAGRRPQATGSLLATVAVAFPAVRRRSA
jgi:hypothetical protein